MTGRRAYRGNTSPSEEAIQKVMAETGMDYLQARNHLIGRGTLQRGLAPLWQPDQRGFLIGKERLQ